MILQNHLSPVSILTEPPNKFSLGALMSELRHPKIFIRKYGLLSSSNYWGGHVGVTKSLVEGMRKEGYIFNYNPPSEKLNKTCIVLSGIDTLVYAISQKKIGKIDKLIAGPNVITIPNEADSLIASQEVDVCLVPSGWVGDLYQSISPELSDRLVIWPAGVDTDFWSPKIIHEKTDTPYGRCLLYIKGDEGKKLISVYVEEFDRIGVSYSVINYGQYSLRQYKTLLSESKIMIVLGGTESQGIAFAEAWSMNVPTLVHSIDSWRSPHGFLYRAEAAPYLSGETGAYFNCLEQLLSLLKGVSAGELKYFPRKWVIRYMSDRVCAHALIEKIHRIGQ